MMCKINLEQVNVQVGNGLSITIVAFALIFAIVSISGAWVEIIYLIGLGIFLALANIEKWPLTKEAIEKLTLLEQYILLYIDRVKKRNSD
ncbi:hypothetical protein [Lysinibacillus sp. LZ02]|uniref:hypothetical protein n=1 Tax=Lysinibacillus sp. LZ02 TaxID=3420668 RepID=UPI003D3670C7